MLAAQQTATMRFTATTRPALSPSSVAEEKQIRRKGFRLKKAMDSGARQSIKKSTNRPQAKHDSARHNLSQNTSLRLNQITLEHLPLTCYIPRPINKVLC